ncbi:mechanosensitive ion channel family protein [Halovivax gelatinilyticus]|uniref:mechanosensitive ion channel family protein n=1 Tax=Halovivax gelatinilyticus TaxID=2961597 RepID=UPI0020CA578A|nr:mechanosensitive ion channel domain-containing protein [Halovivax gelatinilyticus]
MDELSTTLVLALVLSVVEDAAPPWLETAVTEPLVLVPTILFASYLLARVVQWWGTRELPSATDEHSFRRTVLGVTSRPLAITIALIGVYVSFDLLFDGGESTVVVPLLTTVLVVLWMTTSVRLGNRWIEHVKAVDANYEFAPVFKNLWTIGVLLGGLLLLISIWNVDITPFLASAGVLGIVIGIAAQDGISNLIGGIALYFDNTYKIGDVILLEGDMRGTVTDIGVRSTTVVTTDNRLASVPNSVLNSTQVVNETSPQRHVRIEIPFSVAYGTDHREVERLTLEVCEDASLIRESPSPRVLFIGFGDSALEFVARVYIAHPLTEKRARDQFNRHLNDAFENAGITIPFPQRTVSYLEPDDELRFEEDATIGANSAESDDR